MDTKGITAIILETVNSKLVSFKDLCQSFTGIEIVNITRVVPNEEVTHNYHVSFIETDILVLFCF